MSSPKSKNELIERLREVQHEVSRTVRGFSPAQFEQQTGENWSASGYLKHLILSVKPFAKGLGLPKEQLERRFGLLERASMSYDELTAKYQQRLAEGVRAEDYDAVTPGFYRFPEGITDEQTYLADTWDESNDRLINALQTWDEADLDRYAIPHPAIGMITLREMVYFTLHHNTMHWRDIEQAGKSIVVSH